MVETKSIFKRTRWTSWYWYVVSFVCCCFALLEHFCCFCCFVCFFVFFFVTHPNNFLLFLFLLFFLPISLSFPFLPFLPSLSTKKNQKDLFQDKELPPQFLVKRQQSLVVVKYVYLVDMMIVCVRYFFYISQ